MESADWIALYGAVVATAVAVFQAATHFRDNPRITVGAAFTYCSASLDEQQPAARGTLRHVERNGVRLAEEMFISFTVINHGRRAVQISSIHCEELREAKLRTFELTPAPLPVTLEPLSSIEVNIQKEVVDMLDNLTSMGAVDALGRRHKVSTNDAVEIARVSWNSPTRVSWYRRRDAPEQPPVRAFQLQDQARLHSRPARPSRFSRTPTVIVKRESPQLPNTR